MPSPGDSWTRVEQEHKRTWIQFYKAFFQWIMNYWQQYKRFNAINLKTLLFFLTKILYILFQSKHIIPVLSTGEPSELAQERLGVGNPVASHRRITLLPKSDVILVAEDMTDGFTQLSSSAR